MPDSQDSEVQILDDAADLSEGAQAKLLKSLLAEKQQLAQQEYMEGVSKKMEISKAS